MQRVRVRPPAAPRELATRIDIFETTFDPIRYTAV